MTDRAARRLVHTRRITCTAYERDDGMWDVEGTLIDTKPFPITLPERGGVAANEHIHEMTVRVTADGRLNIRDAAAFAAVSPYRACGEITERYRRLVGMQIAPGFSQRVKRLFRAVDGCSHMTELVGPIATTALQVVWWSRERSGRGAMFDTTGGSPTPIDGCHALRRDGDIVRLHFPTHFRPGTGS